MKMERKLYIKNVFIKNKCKFFILLILIFIIILFIIIIVDYRI
jgi:hypothetical protein